MDEDFIAWLEANYTPEQVDNIVNNHFDFYHHYYSAFIAKTEPLTPSGATRSAAGGERLSPEQFGGEPLKEDEGAQLRQLWSEYRRNGGVLTFNEWLDSGQMTIAEETAAKAWIDRLETSLQPQIQAGTMSQEEADSLVTDMGNQLYGIDTHAGNRKLVHELPARVLSGVKQFVESLPVIEQRRIEEEEKLALEAKAEQERQFAATIQQQGILPLGAGGTPQQQVVAGEKAIQQLQTQLGATTGDFQRDVIKDQIRLLQGGVEEIRRTAGELVAQEARKKLPSNKLTRIARELGMTRRDLQIEMSLPEHLSRINSRQRAVIKQEMGGAAVGFESRGEVGRRIREREVFEPPSFDELNISREPRFRQLFASSFPSIARKFSKLPIAQRRGGPLTGGVTGAETWAQLLKRETKRIREDISDESFRRSGFQAPRLKTVRF